MTEKNPSGWSLDYTRFERSEEKLRESLCALGNGYMGVRGAAPETAAGEHHYPATYIAGLFNKLGTPISGKTVYNEDMVNCPNWTFITFRIDGERWFVPTPNTVSRFRQRLDLRSGLLLRDLVTEDRQGRRTQVRSRRLVSMANRHRAAIRYELTPQNYEGWITVRSVLDGRTKNEGVARYKQLKNQHWKDLRHGTFLGEKASPKVRAGDKTTHKEGVFLTSTTNRSGITLTEASRTRAFLDGKEVRGTRTVFKTKHRIGEDIRIFVRKGQTLAVEKIAAIHSSMDRDLAAANKASRVRPGPAATLKAAQRNLAKPVRFEALEMRHARVWKGLWDRFDIQVEGHAFSQQVLRLHAYHLLQTANIHNPDLDAGIPARGLTGEAYRGHIFWDEMFLFFFFSLHLPDAAKSVLMYRYRRLPEARRYAKKDGGHRGAMFPWQSGSRGTEETQTMHLNPLSGTWGPDLSRRQRHISFAIAFNIWRYFHQTRDYAFMRNYGAEMLCGISRFAASLCRLDPRTGRYHTKGIMGPDEFHEKLPGSKEPGLRDNAYSNLMIAWTLARTLETLEFLPNPTVQRLRRKLRLRDAELRLWRDMSRRMCVRIDRNGIIEQFEGYFRLKELDWDRYRTRYGNIHRMDRILKAEGKSPDAYKVAKQADALMVFYLLSPAELRALFGRLGLPYDAEMLRRNYDYYVGRTSHGSTLSKVIHSFAAQRIGREKEAWAWYMEALRSDVEDTQGGTTPEGIHCGVMGGTIHVAYRAFAGLTLQDDRMRFDPAMPKAWKRLRFRILFRGMWFSIEVDRRSVSIRMDSSKRGHRFAVDVRGEYRTLGMGKKVRIRYAGRAA